MFVCKGSSIGPKMSMKSSLGVRDIKFVGVFSLGLSPKVVCDILR